MKISAKSKATDIQVTIESSGQSLCLSIIISQAAYTPYPTRMLLPSAAIMDEDLLHALYSLFPDTAPDYLAEMLQVHGGDLHATVDTLLHQPVQVEVLRPPSAWREQPRNSHEVDSFKRDMGRLLQGDASKAPNPSKPLPTLIKDKLKRWFSRKKQLKEEEKDSASTVSPSEPDEEVISFYAPEGLRRGERPPHDRKGA